MNINHLKYFLAVAKNQSFTKAAQEMHISQPSISKMIKNMEDELGVPLFQRDKRKIELTDAGHALYQQTHEIINSFENLTTTISNIVNLKKGHIKIGIPPIVGASFFPQAIGDFIQNYPDIEIELIEVGSKTIEAAIASGELDVGIVCCQPSNQDLFEVTTILNDPLMVTLYPDHPKANSKSISLLELKDEKLVLFREDFSLHDHIIVNCEAAGFSPHIICRSSQRDFMIEMVAAKLGIALLPKKVCQELDPQRIKSVPLAGMPLFLNLMIITKKDKYLSFAIREWLSFTVAHLNENAQ